MSHGTELGKSAIGTSPREREGGGGRWGYPEPALAGAAVAGDAVNPEDVAAGVDLHEVALGRRPELDLREVEPVYAAAVRASKAIAAPQQQPNQAPNHRGIPEGRGGEGRGAAALSAGTYVPGVGGEAEAAEREVGGREEAAVAAPVVGAESSDAASPSSSSVCGEPAAHLEDPGGRGAGRRQQQQQQRSERGEAEGEEGGARRGRGHRLLVGEATRGREEANGEFETALRRLRAASV
jgi:hypothetical protein